MRTLMAFVLGFLVAVGGAFLRDSTADPGTRPFVNWEVVRDSTHRAAAMVGEQWDRLTRGTALERRSEQPAEPPAERWETPGERWQDRPGEPGRPQQPSREPYAPPGERL